MQNFSTMRHIVRGASQKTSGGGRIDPLLPGRGLSRCKFSLALSDHQFGFKEGHSTDMVVYALKELVDYYLRNRSSVFICFIDLDARKAFDRVNHWTLFETLIRRGVNVDIVRLLLMWYEPKVSCTLGKSPGGRVSCNEWCKARWNIITLFV